MMQMEDQIKAASGLSKQAIYSLFLYEAARRARRRNIICFVAEGSFRGNAKYGFLTINKIFKERQINCEVAWLGGPKDQNILSSYGYSAIKWDNSWTAADKVLHASAMVYGNFDWPSENSYQRQLCTAGARRIYLGHGVPAKQIAYAQIQTRQNIFSFAGMAFETLGYTDVISESKSLEQTYNDAFPSADVHHLGSVRNDIFARSEALKDAELYGLDNDNYQQVLKVKHSGKRVILYAPTYREKKQSLQSFIRAARQFYAQLEDRDDVLLLIKYHPGLKNYASEDTAELYHPTRNALILGDSEDIQPYLRETDLLITDYSSIYYDYLLLNRPVIFFQPDRSEYEAARVRSYYPIADELTVGETVETPEALPAAITAALQMPEAHSADRQRFAKFLHQHGNDGKAGERLANFFIKSLGLKSAKRGWFR